MKYIRHFILFFVFTLSLITYAQIPQTMSYQGILTDNNNSIVPDGSYSLTFRLYDAASAGNEMWSETQNVSVTDGLFNVILGSKSPLNLPFDKQYWLGISIGNNAELTPRITLTASPYSLNSHSTLAETEPGQGLTIRNSAGETTHEFSANGDVLHTGTGTFKSGIIVGDSAVVPMDTSGVPGSKTLTLKKNKNKKIALSDVGISAKGTYNGVLGESPNAGVQGQSNNGIGVYGVSLNGLGVLGKSTENIGVYGVSYHDIAIQGRSIYNDGIHGISRDGIGIKGESTNGWGIYGVSETSVAIEAESKSGGGIYAYSQTNVGISGQSSKDNGIIGISDDQIGVVGVGPIAGVWADGQLKVSDVSEAPQQERFLVWDADSIVKYRTMPTGGGGSFDGILVNKPLVVENSAGDAVFRVDTSGASLHTGDETFEGDVIFKGERGKGAKLVDANGNTLAGFGRIDLDTKQRLGVYGRADQPGDLAGAFDGDVDVRGEITTNSLHIRDYNGNPVTDFNSDGTSTHKGIESYTAGLDIVNADGNSALKLVPNTNPVTEYGLRANCNVRVMGITYTDILQAGEKQFKIDDPLDPEHKYLEHASVESSELKNIYDGTVILNANGEAWVELPQWFEALNKDFRYQLTCIGGYSQVYIAEEIQNNRFKIGGGKSGLKVSWLVTGIRKDAYAQTHPFKVEEMKSPQNVGKYLNPEAYGLPKEKGIFYSSQSEQQPENEGLRKIKSSHVN